MVTRRQPPAPTVLAGLVRQTVVVTLLDESGARGVVWSVDDTGLMLVPAAGEPVETWAEGHDWEPAPGAMFVPAPAIKFVQIPGGVQ